MANINLEIQPSLKGKNPKTNPENPAQRLSLTVQKNSTDTPTKVRFHIPTKSNEEKVQPLSEENPRNVELELGSQPPKPKPKKSRLKLILKIIATVIVIVVVVNFILWVVISPRKMKVYVTNAKLSEFSLHDDKTLHYNLFLNFTVRNPNKRIGFHYESVVVGAYYDGEKFDSGNLLTFHQPPKSTNSGLETWFSGAKSLSLDWDQVVGFKELKSSGVYPIDVKIRVYSSIKLGKIHVGDFKVKIKCGLKVPLTSNIGDESFINTVSGFKTTQCHVDFNPLLVINND